MQNYDGGLLVATSFSRVCCCGGGRFESRCSSTTIIVNHVEQIQAESAEDHPTEKLKRSYNDHLKIVLQTILHARYSPLQLFDHLDKSGGSGTSRQRTEESEQRCK